MSCVVGEAKSALTSALRIGVTHLPMARWSVGALEHWRLTLPSHWADQLLQDVIPFLEPYLRNSDIHGNEASKTTPKSSTIKV